MARLSIHLAKAQEEIEGYAREYKLDFFETIFEILEFDELNQIAAYGGFPKRYPHWSFGMEFEQLSKGYEYGLSKIYELVINNNPCYAYLLKSNPMVDQKLVMAHVYGHCDFFKNNYWFSKTNRKMIDKMADHATQVHRYIDEHGFDKVEAFIDACKSIENLIDYNSPFVEHKSEPQPLEKSTEEKTDPFQNNFSKNSQPLSKRIKEKSQLDITTPQIPEKDILLYLLQYGKLEDWQYGILSIIRDEAYYFAPQAQTKIMNEGWASYWHSKMMTQHILNDSEIIDYADHHAGALTTSPGGLNPYKIGIELFRDIEERWNRGQFGRQYEDCTNRKEKKNWDQKLGLGREKIFQVRKMYNDLSFLDEFLTQEFCEKHKLFVFGMNTKTNEHEILSREFAKIKKQLLSSLTNLGRPIIRVQEGDFEGRGELLLSHQHEGVDLKYDWAKVTLQNLFLIWQKPVNLLTVLGEKQKLITFNGSEFTEKLVEDRS